MVTLRLQQPMSPNTELRSDSPMLICHLTPDTNMTKKGIVLAHYLHPSNLSQHSGRGGVSLLGQA